MSGTLASLAGMPVARREFAVDPAQRVAPGQASVGNATQHFVPLDTVDPTAQLALRMGIGQTVPETSRLYGLATDAALNFAGTTPMQRLSMEEQNALRQMMNSRYPMINSWFGQGASGHLQLNKIHVLPEMQRQGLGTAFMRDLVAEADARGLPMALSPDAEWGGNVRRLREFYRRFGFVPNRGPGRDLTTYETMVRPAREAP